MLIKKEPIALVGMGLRFPGDIGDAESFWQALIDQQDLVTEVDPSRWDTSLFQHDNKATPGTSYTFAAGQLSNIDQFDAQFFGISPREAAQMDPQQRLLLELTWQALANGQQRVDSLAGSNCAVFIGIASNDYGNRAVDDMSVADAYTMTGNTASIAANRLSYQFDLKGPSIAVDTACSSSLVAVHEACKSLWLGEADSALTGGVNMLLHPSPFVGFAKASMLSPTGRCKPFDSSADGYVRSEGAAVVFLKRLSDAERDGDPIHAVITHSGINSDGSTNGISLPSLAGQSALLDQLYHVEKGFNINHLDYLEAHGTGTPVGDPIEARSIGETLAQHREHNHVLPIGSVKGNVGHLETASGMAGLIKVVQSLKHRMLAPSHQLSELNPEIDFDALNLSVVQSPTSLVHVERTLTMGVNSFGFGGTNAHLILQEYDQQKLTNHDEDAAADLAMPPLYLTANTELALADLAKRYTSLIHAHPQRYAAIASQAMHKQSRLKYGLLIDAPTPESIEKSLQAASNGQRDEFSYRGQRLVPSIVAKAPVIMVYSGNGCQWQGMATRLYECDVLFRNYIHQLDTAFESQLDFSIVEQLQLPGDQSNMHLTDYAQPLLFAIQVALTQWLNAKGVKADYFLGHSVGEIAAAWASGSLSLKDAITVIVVRSRAQALTRGTGRMAAMNLSLSAAKALLERLNLGSLIEIACHNSVDSVTLAGTLADLSKIEQACQQDGIFYRLLDLDYAFHSRFMDPLYGHLISALADIKPKISQQFISTIDDLGSSQQLLDAEYWWRNIRQRVLFAEAIDNAVTKGGRIFIEIGAKPILRRYIQAGLANRSQNGLVIETLSDRVDDSEAIKLTQIKAFLAGADVQFSEIVSPSAQATMLPNYPWQRQRHWYQSTVDSTSVVDRRQVHPLLGQRINSSLPVWEQTLDSQKLPYLADHVVDQVVVLPGAAFVEMAFACCRDWFQIQFFDVTNFAILVPLVLHADDQRTVRCELDLARRKFMIKSRLRLSDDPWLLHCVGQLTHTEQSSDSTLYDLQANQATDDFWQHHPVLNQDLPIKGTFTEIDSSDYYRRLSVMGLQYGEQFRIIDRLWCRQGVAHASLHADRFRRSWAASDNQAIVGDEAALLSQEHILHPVVLDGCFQLVGALVATGTSSVDAQQNAYLPIGMGRIQYFGHDQVTMINAVIRGVGVRSLIVDFSLCNEFGNPQVLLQQCRFKMMPTIDTLVKADHYHWQAMLSNRANNAPLFFKNVEQWQEATEEQDLTTLGSEVDRYFAEIEPLLNTAISYAVVEVVADLASDLYDQNKIFDRPSLTTAARAKNFPSVYIDRLLDMIIEDELLSLDGGDYRFSPRASETNYQEIWQLILEDYPIAAKELSLIASRFRTLQLVVQQGEHATEALTSQLADFSVGALSGTVPQQGLQALALNAVQVIIGQRDFSYNIDILELNACDSDIASVIAPQLLDEDCFDLFSCQQSLVYKMEEQHAEINCLTPHYITMPSDFDAQQSTPIAKQYDVIILNHFVSKHQQPDIFLKQLKKWLKPNGLLLLVEQSPSRISDFVFGASLDWWLTTNSTAQSALIPAAALLQHLLNNGYHSELMHQSSDPQQTGGYLLFCQARSQANVQSGRHALVDESLSIAESFEEGSESLLAFEQESKETVVDTAREVWLVMVGQAQSAQWHEWWQQLRLTDPVAQAIELTIVEYETVNVDDLALFFDSKAVHPSRVIDATYSSNDGVSSQHACHRADFLRNLLQYLQTLPAERQFSLDLITQQSQGVMGEPSVCFVSTVKSPSDAVVWGMGRVAMNELSGIDIRLIDIEPSCLALSSQSLLFEELCRPVDGESEIFLHQQKRFVNRLMPLKPLAESELCQASDTITYLDVPASGKLNTLLWLTKPAPSLAATQLRIKPVMAGLNFRDVMFATGLLPDEALENGFSGPTLGMEFSGVVTAVGDELTDFSVGDQVLGFAPESFASEVVTESFAVVKKPETWSHAEAATVPTVFFTAYYSLVYLAKLRAGERVLIHGAAGGVGLAAIQIAKNIGADIYATAGTEDKRDFIKLLGAHRVFDSRSLQFADQINDLTQGQGVDVVLNSLAGEAIDRNLSIMRPFGRFLELGKRDFYADTAMGLRPFRNNISYFGVDVDQLMSHQTELIQPLMREVFALLDTGVLYPICHRVFTARQTVDAFRYMQRSQQIGKVVIDLSVIPQANTSLISNPVSEQVLTLKSDASYLVTGGSSGLGLAMVRWLGDRGAKHIIVVSRQGMISQAAVDLCTKLRQSEINIIDLRLDLTHSDAHSNLEAALVGQPPLRGTIHAATRFDDLLLNNMGRQNLLDVLSPKIKGAEVLHHLTSNMTLDFFVLFSSATTAFGNPGQANYVAANSYLEALSAYRRQLQLPSLCLAWGGIDDVGVLARNTALKETFSQRLGAQLLSSSTVISVLEKAIIESAEDSSYLAVDWHAMRSKLLSAKQNKFRFFNAFDDLHGSDHSKDIREKLLTLPPERRFSEVAEILAIEVEKILFLSHGGLDRRQSLFEQGMDSLMGVELATTIESSFGIQLSTMVLAEGPTIERLSQIVLKEMHLSAEDDGIVISPDDQELSLLAIKHGTAVSDDDYQRVKEALAREQK